MKETVRTTILLVVAAFAFGQNNGHTFTGEIMDKQCAQMGSHQNMMQAMGAKNAKECTLACSKNGDKLVLFDSGAKKVYVVEDDQKVRQYAGQRVQITGSYDGSTDTLKVKSVAPTK